MSIKTNKSTALFLFALGIAGLLVYLFFLQGSFPLPTLGFLLPNREIVTSTLPLQLKWVYESGDPIVAQPFIVPNHIIARTNNSFIGINASDARTAWDVRVGGLSGARVHLSYEGKNLVVAARGDTGLDSINAQTGGVNWSTTFTSNPNFISALTTDRQTAFVGLNRALQQSMRGYGLENGHPNWSPDPDLPSGITPSPLIIQDNILYVFQGASLYLLDPKSSKIIKSLEGFVGGGTSITLEGNTVYMWYQQGLIAKDILSSEVLWRYKRVPFFYTLEGNRIIVYSECCKLALLDAQKGTVFWERDIDTRVIAPMVIVKGTAYAMGEDGVIIAYNLTTGDEQGRLVTSPTNVNYFNKQIGMATNGLCLYATFGDRQLFAFC